MLPKLIEVGLGNCPEIVKIVCSVNLSPFAWSKGWARVLAAGGSRRIVQELHWNGQVLKRSTVYPH